MTKSGNLPGMETDLVPTSDPWTLFDAWYAEAEAQEPHDANAMSLATVGEDGLPSVRMVLMKGHGAEPPGQDNLKGRGVVFFTNSGSRKGQELAANGKAALCFHWKSLRRQIRLRGPVMTVIAAEADAYFASRPRGSQIGAWASEQSQFLDRRETLESRVEQYEIKFNGREVPRPQDWKGYRLTPLEIEFWANRRSRLHDRLVYRRNRIDAGWTIGRLYP